MCTETVNTLLLRPVIASLRLNLLCSIRHDRVVRSQLRWVAIKIKLEATLRTGKPLVVLRELLSIYRLNTDTTSMVSNAFQIDLVVCLTQS